MADTDEFINPKGLEYLIPQLNTTEYGQSHQHEADKGLDTKVYWANIKGDITQQTDLWQILTDMEEEIAQISPSGDVFVYKGQVPTYADLPNDAKVGDVWDVAEDGANYVWNGTNWDKLSDNIDLSEYAKLEDVYTKLELDELLDTRFEYVYTKSEMDLLLTDKASVAELNAVAGNLDIEAQARVQADGTLQTNINKVAEDLQRHIEEAEDDFVTREDFNQETQARTEKDTALENKFNNYMDIETTANYVTGEIDNLANTVSQLYVGKSEIYDNYLVDYYQKTETYSKDQVDELIQDIDAGQLRTDLEQEIQDRQAADKALDGRLDTLEAKDVVEYTDISNPENPNRKAIVFKNHDGVFGKDTDGNTRNIAMISKYNVADFGTPHLHTNLNTQQIVTVNDVQAVLTDKNLNNVLLAGDNVTIDEELVTEPTTGFVFKTYTVNAELSGTSTKIDELADALEAEVQDRQNGDEALQNDLTQLATDLETGLSAKANVSETYNKSEVDEMIADLDVETIFHFKGSLATVADLDNVENPKVGDVYNITETGANYAWDGTVWDKLSETIDLSPYDTIEAREAAMNALLAKIWTGSLANGHLYSKKTNAQGGYALIFNESDGGGSQVYDKTDDVISYIGTNLEEGEGAENGVNVQIYSKNKTTNEGVRINVNTQKAYYLKGANVPNPAEREIAVVDDITTAKAEIQEALDEKASQQEFEDLQSTVDDSLAHQDGNIQTLLLQMQELASKIEDLKSLDYEVVSFYDGGETQYNNPIKDFQLSGHITSPAVITSNSVTLKEATMTGTYMDLYADQDVTIKQSSFSGSVPKATSNAIMRLRANGYITVRDYNFEIEKAYNGIECNLTEAAAKSIIIDGVDFNGPLSNNGVNVFGMADGGVLTIANCHFKKVSNMIRISNRLNTTWTINLINCVCDEWETNSDYTGAILLQDYISKSAAEVETRNEFSKLTINIQNLTKPDGTKLTPTDNLSTICGSKDNNQILYVYDSFHGVRPYDTGIYPTIHII